MEPEDIALLFIIGIIGFYILIAVIANSLNELTDYRKIVEKQQVTYDGKVLSSIYFPMKRGIFKIWHKIHIPVLKYSTPTYCAPLYRKKSCNDFNLVVDIVNAEPLFYKDYKLKPIIAYSIAKRQDVVIYYCSKYRTLNHHYNILGTENECKTIIDVFINGGAHSRFVKFEHKPIKKF